VTFYPLPIFVVAKTVIASNAPKLRRYAANATEGRMKFEIVGEIE